MILIKQKRQFFKNMIAQATAALKRLLKFIFFDISHVKSHLIKWKINFL